MVGFSSDTWPPLTTVATTLTTVATTAVLLSTVANTAVPEQLQSYIAAKFKKITGTLNPETTVVVDEFNGIAPNKMFEAAHDYLGSKLSPATRRISACKIENESEIKVSIDAEEKVVDVYEGVRVNWVLLSEIKRCRQVQKGFRNNNGEMSEMRYFELKFQNKFRVFVLERYNKILDNGHHIVKCEWEKER